MQFFIAAYPWDLLDEPVDDVLDHLRGELGVTGLAIHVACPAALQLRVRSVDPRIVRSRGGLFFRPSPERYGATRCKPIVSSRIGKSDPLSGWARACESHDLELRVMISAAATGRMAERYPEAACKNVFGDTSRVAVCLSNPDVQAYLLDLVADVGARPGAGSVCLNDLVVGWLEAYTTELETSVPLSNGDRMLLSTCFCESCQQRAMENGVDPVIARRAVQLALDARLKHGPGQSGGFGQAGAESVLSVKSSTALEGEIVPPFTSRDDIAVYKALCDSHKPFARYVDLRAHGLASLLDRLADVCDGDLVVRTSADGLVGEQHRHIAATCWSDDDSSGTSSSRIAALYEMGLASFDDDEAVVPPVAREVAVWSGLHEESDAPRLVRLVTQAARTGVRGVMFEHYGAWGDAARTAIKQGVRFARRTATT